jgi:hypothetical protein
MVSVADTTFAPMSDSVERSVAGRHADSVIYETYLVE